MSCWRGGFPHLSKNKDLEDIQGTLGDALKQEKNYQIARKTIRLHKYGLNVDIMGTENGRNGDLMQT